MSEIEKVIIRTRKLEHLLRVQYHAEGRGLHQLISSCEDRLPHDVIKKLRYIATIRNKLLHEADYSLDDCESFLEVYDECMKELTPRSGRFIWRAAISLMMIITLLALGVYYIHWEFVSSKLFE
ncbi:DUF4145 domain-containing protein [Vibrio mangrovi]|uniref:DUF4145 domain-containing protein n=1 Tax=Vibrio mangrovi TaxID=474394 RepID=A0A1Y6IW23_9VIBR|nr:DUF4145 domain-containing protein [Vibrio mangrovi]MDW6002594.1 DUF4145 domain-containing protein [Vibrio mangrovi]SMS01875.1 hypothetical protein VIM7927_03184 [Vibrio mangrovi]